MSVRSQPARAARVGSVVRIVLALLVMTSLAHAERRNVLWHDLILVLRPSNMNRIEVGGGASTGWRDLADAYVRYHATDRHSIAARERFDRAGARVHELELAYVLGRGKMRFPGDLFTRADLVVDAGGGFASLDRDRGLAFAGARVRFQPNGLSWLAIELGVRESWVPLAPAAIARSLGPLPPDRGFATELSASVGVLWPFMRYAHCY